jgi:hypothetical protein
MSGSKVMPRLGDRKHKTHGMKIIPNNTPWEILYIHYDIGNKMPIRCTIQGSVPGKTNGYPTEKIFDFIDLHLRQHVEDLPSYSKDTTDYLNKTPFSGLPDHTLLVTMDVTSLYTNIPHD